MNTVPAAPYPGPLPPVGVPPVPPYGHPVLQVIDPPLQVPTATQPPVPVLPESQAPRALAQCYNVRSFIPDDFPSTALGLRFEPLSLGRGRIGQYRRMSKKKWNELFQITGQNNDGIESLEILLRNIWLSCYHHQQQLVIGRVCAVYALPRSCRAWDRVIPTLLAAFRVQFYVEDHNYDGSLWADFSNSARPHSDEIDAAVDAALAMVLWYRPCDI